MSEVSLLAELAQARGLTSAIRLVARLEKEHGYGWRAVGDRENNYGSVNWK